MTNITLEITRGDTKSYTVKFIDSNNNAIDITGATVFFTVKENIDQSDDDAVIKKTLTTFANPTDGEAVITLSSTDTNLVGNYIFDIQLKTSSGSIKTIAEGIISFQKDVTQRTS